MGYFEVWPHNYTLQVCCTGFFILKSVYHRCEWIIKINSITKNYKPYFALYYIAKKTLDVTPAFAAWASELSEIKQYSTPVNTHTLTVQVSSTVRGPRPIQARLDVTRTVRAGTKRVLQGTQAPLQLFK